MPEKTTFDYVIVGGGSAGCVVACRLIEAGASVCLLEAGGSDRHPLISVPAGFGRLLGDKPFWAPDATWGYKTTPQKHLNGRVLDYLQGRVLGGGSSVNAMIYARGHPQDYDRWEQEGARGWNYESVLPFFKKSERDQSLDLKFHGRDGYLDVTPNKDTTRISQAFVAAAQECGLPLNQDFNGAVQDGVGFHMTTRVNGSRNNTATAFLRRHMNSSQLEVKLNAHVIRFLTSGSSVSGVEFRIKGESRLRSVRASQEYVLASGSLGSPKTLMLSGIGPADALHKLGISPVLDHPEVGANLQDHLDSYVVAHCSGPFGFHGDWRPWQELKWLVEYLLKKTGPLASNFVEAGAFLRLDPKSTAPDTQFHLMPAYVIDAGREKVKGYGVSLYTSLLRPTSRGTVKLASSDPRDLPIIDPNFMSDRYEVDMAILAVEKAREVFGAKAFRSHLAGQMLPSPRVRTRKDLELYVRSIAKTDYHPVGTCRMGSDGRAVVGPDLKLNGCDNLRVVDASVMPSIVGGNTNAPTIMIAEKASAALLSSQ